ncbi:MAG: hypothetical protein NC830_07060, partial [Candidatus Omnitrophica bacterium]|nr:hypothetical protein [Candidatus Omnitrophota bacterium]
FNETKDETKKEYTQLTPAEPTYQRLSPAEKLLFEDASVAAERAAGGVDVRKFGIDIELESQLSEKQSLGTGEYKRRDILRKIERIEEEKREEYKRKIKIGIV